ncbi:serine hydrolase domain-containing protein [Silvanigrella aquatica]|uniref:Beta-lactamase-related domain-containing protein n=1 Tax=Silvanigrella aquatica TaxID=1915309 RepID=A0A1L4CYA3_9BACT|nr:serine hydrolase domain-containing protein [Silvanigrella aquatica]APJ02926.1 hypothetical protein AXG55_02935 [Silvanigrella aquatica]
MIPNLLKYLKKIFCIQIIYFVFGCTDSSSKQSPSIKFKPKEIFSIQARNENLIKLNTKEVGITGVLTTVQCPKFNKGEAFTYFSGTQNLEGAFVSEKSLFQMGTSSKLLLTVIALQLEEEERLSLNDEISKFLPDIFPNWQNITLRQLLNNTSGIPPIEMKKYINSINDFKKEFIIEHILKIQHEMPLNFKSGLKWENSDTNILLTSYIIEKITSHKIKFEIENRILNPLNLSRFFYIHHVPDNEIPAHEKNNIIHGYFYSEENGFKKFNKMSTHHFSVSLYNAAAAWTANSIELNSFIRSLFNKNSNNKSLLKEKKLNEMLSFIDNREGQGATTLPEGVNKENKSGYGVGVKAIYNDLLEAPQYLSEGKSLGMTSYISYIPSLNASYVLVVNSSHMGVSEEAHTNLKKFVHLQCL